MQFTCISNFYRIKTRINNLLINHRLMKLMNSSLKALQFSSVRYFGITLLKCKWRKQNWDFDEKVSSFDKSKKG